MTTQIVTGLAGGCFWCNSEEGNLIVKTIKCAYDNGEPTTATLIVCQSCKGKK
jgi:peptide methionine sulfoxide reductase MsrA